MVGLSFGARSLFGQSLSFKFTHICLFMKLLYRFTFLWAFIFLVVDLSAQELKLKSFVHKELDLTAKIANVRDNNDNPCALVRIYVALREVEFKASSGIKEGPTSDRPSEYKLFLPAGSRSITIYGNGYLPFTYAFEEEILGLHTYELYLEVPIITDYAQILEQQTKMLQNQSAAPATPAVQEKRWKVGDYYNENGKEGVVFWVDATCKHGKIISMLESGAPLHWTSDQSEQKRLIGAYDQFNGAKNMEIVRQIPDWESKYPAFAWCADLGEGWYLPAIEELRIFTMDNEVHDTVNRTLALHNGKQLANKSAWKLHCYWSSSEKESSGKKITAYFISMDPRGARAFGKGFLSPYVRAVSAF